MNKTKLISLVVLTAIIIIIPVEVHSASGFLEVIDPFARHNSPLTVKVYDLNATQKYLINWTTDDVGITFISIPDQSYQNFQLNVRKGVDNSITIYLRDYTTGQLYDSGTVYFIERTEYSMAALFDLLPPIIAFLICVFAFFIPALLILRKAK